VSSKLRRLHPVAATIVAGRVVHSTL
jgi:hypothetical protein